MLADNLITATGARALIDALALHNITLKAVDLGGNPVSVHPSGQAVLAELQGVLQRNRVIKKAPGTPSSSVVKVLHLGHAAPGADVKTALFASGLQQGDGQHATKAPCVQSRACFHSHLQT